MGGGHGIGVKRNDYHRKNRRENKGHRWRGSRGNQEAQPADEQTITLRSGIRLIKRTGGLTFEHLAEFNALEEAALVETEEVPEDDEIIYFQEALSSLASSRFLYLPPFLKPEEIRRRRFSGAMNDDWWKWEEERELSSNIGRPRIHD